MPRGKYYSTEVREEARRLRREGWSLRETSKELGIPRNTLTLWLRDIELMPTQNERLREKKLKAGFANEHSRFLAAEWHRRRKLDRIEAERQKAKALLDSLDQPMHANHIAAAMLYLGEGSKAPGVCAFANARACYELHGSRRRARDHGAAEDGKGAAKVAPQLHLC